MWPLERKRDVLRIGRERAEYWIRTSTGLEVRARHDLGAEPGMTETLEAELRNWLQGLGAERARLNPVDIVLESAWLPVMLVEVGRGAWSRGQVERLLRHRIAQLYLQPGAEAVDWRAQLDYRPGDAQALGFALAPSIWRAVLDATAAAGQRVASLQPALAWARQQRGRQARCPRTGWWVWNEQDRAIVCRIERGRVTAMNAGAVASGNEEECARLVAAEAARSGVAGTVAPVVMARWDDLPAQREDAPGHKATTTLAATT